MAMSNQAGTDKAAAQAPACALANASWRLPPAHNGF